MPEKYDDTDIIDLFKNFEMILPEEKADIDWLKSTDFKVYSEYLVKDIEEIQARLKEADDAYIYYVCQHTFNILDWIKLFVEDAGLSTFGNYCEDLFQERFGDKQILQSSYDECFEKWIRNKSGQQKIGQNYYNIINERAYYRNLLGKWFEVDYKTIFDLSPKFKIVDDLVLVDKLQAGYVATWYDKIIRQWDESNYMGKLPIDFLDYKPKETMPDDYLEFSLKNIKELLANPVSLSEIEDWYGEEIDNIDLIIKLASFVTDITNKRRSEDSHTLYLLRDCLTFQEMHKTLDLLNGANTSSGQVLIGRKLLSHKEDHWGYYSVILDALFTAHLRYPDNFIEFYNEFARLMDMFVSMNSNYAQLVADLAEYIKKHIITDKLKIDIFDTGFQGSINLFTKYIIDNHIRPNGLDKEKGTDIKIGVGAQWSKELFGYRYDSDYFPLLNRIQLLKRSNELYHYKFGSLEDGRISVIMGDKSAQRKAAVELAVFVMVAKIKNLEL